MIVSCQNSLGIGISEPPIINAFNVSGSSARAIGTDEVDISVSDTPANSALMNMRLLIASLCPKKALMRNILRARRAK